MEVMGRGADNDNVDQQETEEKYQRSSGIRYASIKDDVASLLQQSIYIPCTFDLCVPLWKYASMPAQPQFNGLRIHIGAPKIMHDTMTSIRSIRCMVKHTKNHLQHNAIIEFRLKLGNTWFILTFADKTVKWCTQHEFQT